MSHLISLVHSPQALVVTASASYNGSVRIGEASTESGVPERMIRHYEKLGLVNPPSRTGGNYRDYGDDDVRRLRFIGLARDLGIPMEVIAGVMRHWGAPSEGTAELGVFGDMLSARARAAVALTAEFERVRDRSKTTTCP